MSGLTTVSSCCDHLLCKHTHNFYLVVWAFVLLCLSFSLTTWWKQYERLHYLIWFSASLHKIVHSWYSDCRDGSQAEPSWAEQITSLLVCLTQGQTTRGILLAPSLLTSTQTSVNSCRWGWISNILVKMHSKQLVGSAHIDFWILLISISLIFNGYIYIWPAPDKYKNLSAYVSVINTNWGKVCCNLTKRSKLKNMSIRHKNETAPVLQQHMFIPHKLAIVL